MIASTLVRSLRSSPAVASRSFATRPAFAFTQVQALPKRAAFAPRFYSAPAGLSKDTVTERIVDVLKSFEKVDAAKVLSVAADATLPDLIKFESSSLPHLQNSWRISVLIA